MYYYFYNAQGDVMGLYDNNLNVVVEYAYDSWGNVASITGSMADTLGQDNPFRYRGYYFDSDTGLYYLNSRYYDANTGRFINADGYYDTHTGLLSHNMFTYCNNNPIVFTDPTGKSLGLALLGLALLGGSMLFLSGCSAKSTPTSDNKEVQPYGTYDSGKGNVYIVPESDVEKVSSTVKEKDVIIVDNRNETDPNMQVKESYKITSSKHKEEIAQLMLDYNNVNPVAPPWNRSKDSIVTEWELHNLAYRFGYKRERTADTDFNNADEGVGFWDLVGR